MNEARANTPPTFGRLLRRFRRDAGLTQEELAERAHLSARAVSDLERAEGRHPRRDTLELLVAALELAPGDRALLEATVRRTRSTPRPRAREPVLTLLTSTPISTRSVLPDPSTPFIGRERELEEVSAMARRPEARLLTLTGPGGTGKTRLALQVGNALLGAFPAGVFFVSLASLTDPGLVPATIARTLGVAESGGQPIAEILVEYLRDKRMLLILDNFEHLLDACAIVGDLLTACKELKALVTSRAPLHLSREHLLPVPPLSVPDPAHLPDLATLTQNDAVALFAQRARAVKPDFAVTEANAPTVAEICVRLDGLPLALELAAARIKLLPPRALLTRLDGGLKLLTGGPRDLPARQQTLHGTIDWSYNLLTADERQLFARLAVFAGGFTLESAEVVCAADGNLAFETLDGVASLVEKSLLRQEEGPGGDPRFGMLETIREYGLNRLQEHKDAALVRRAHAHYFQELAEHAEPALRGANQREWLDRLDAEHDNLRAALREALERGVLDMGLRLASALRAFWLIRGRLSEGREWMERMLAAANAIDQPDAPVPSSSPAARARVLHGAGVLAAEQGDYRHAAARAEESLSTYRDLDDMHGQATVLTLLGAIAWYQGDYARGITLQAESVALMRRAGDKRGVAIGLNNMGNAAKEQGDYARAAALHAESLALKRELGDTRGIAIAVNNLGDVAFAQGQYERAASLFEESLTLSRDIGDTRTIALALNNLGTIASRQGNHEQAAALSEESLALFQGLGHTWGIGLALSNLADVACQRGNLTRTIQLYEESLVLGNKGNDRVWAARCLEGLALVMSMQGQPESAARTFGAAAALCDSAGAPVPTGDRDAYDRALLAVRTTMGDNAFSAAWSTGRTRPDEVIAKVIERH